MKIYFVRHGETPNNMADKYYVEEEEVALTEKGIMQAKLVAEQIKDIKFDACYCSPRKRAKQTAEYLLKNHPQLEIIYDKRIWERLWGEASGCHISVTQPGRWQRHKQFSYKGIETVDEVFARAKSFYDEIKQKHKNKNVLVVSHSGFGRVSHCYFYGFPESGDLGEIKIKNSELIVFSPK